MVYVRVIQSQMCMARPRDAKQNTSIFLTSNACLTSRNTRFPFPRALSGPFDRLLLRVSSFPRSLLVHLLPLSPRQRFLSSYLLTISNIEHTKNWSRRFINLSIFLAIVFRLETITSCERCKFHCVWLQKNPPYITCLGDG